MTESGLTVKVSAQGTRVELQCPHQNGLLYAVAAEASWVCTDELRHAHALAGFLGELVKLGNPQVQELMQRWGLYFRVRPLRTTPQDEAPSG